MIVRTWHGCVPRRLVMPLRFICRRLACSIRRAYRETWEHFFLATYWSSLDAVKAFAGEDYHVAVTYADDEQFQLLSDPYVFQFDVAKIVEI